MQDHNTHRELIAAIASLKSCTRSVISAVSGPKCGSPTSVCSKIPGSLQRANDAVSNLQRLLSAASDQTVTLPLSTSRRLVEVELPELLEQLLTSCLPTAAWPVLDSGTSDHDSNGDDSSLHNNRTETAQAINHPSWGDVQQLIAGVFQVLSLLCGVAVRAYTRSSDPLVVLLQLSSPKVMQACVMYMEHIWDVHLHAQASATAAVTHQDASEAAMDSTTASNSFACAVSAFSNCYSLLAAAVDVQSGLQELELQLVKSLCSTHFLTVAVKLLLSATCGLGQQHAFEVECQHAGWHLLTLALFLSGGDIAINPASPSSVEVRPGQHIPSSVLAAYMRQQDEAKAAVIGIATTQALIGVGSEGPAAASIAATEAATGLPLSSMQQQVLGPYVLRFLEERLYHTVQEMRGSSCNTGCMEASAATQQDSSAPKEQPLLLPGRCVPDDQDVLAAVLRTLRCWRALLVGPSGPTLPIASPRGLHLLLAVLSGALAESIKDSSSERQALRGRLVRVAVHCLQLLCGCVKQQVLVGQLFGLTSALSKVVGAAGAYWDANKRAVKSVDLPFTGQVRCVDKATGDMMVRYTMAADSALSVLQQLVAACSTQTAGPITTGCEAVAVMLSAGLLPPIEQLFRQVPTVSPAHVAAADLLVQVIPLCGSAPLSAGQLPLLTTLRKFLVKAVGVPQPDREAAYATATKLADMLARLCSSCSSNHGGVTSNCCILLQHASTHLLPALQMYCTAALRGPVPALCSSTPGCTATRLSDLPGCHGCHGSGADASSPHLYPCVLTMYQQLARAAKTKPELGLRELLLGNQALAVSAAVLGSNYWACQQVAAAAAQPGNGHLTAQHAAGLVTAFLEDLLGTTPHTPADSPAAAAAAQLHISSSDDCLCAIKCSNAGLCSLGNPLCGVDGPCDCGSPKAYSDAAAHTNAAPAEPAATTAAPVQDGASNPSPRSQSQADQQQRTLQRQLLLSALLQSKLLPELHRLLQQLPAGLAANMLEGFTSGGGGAGVPNRQSSLSSSMSAAVPVPRTSSGNVQSRDSSRVGGHSPTFSLLNPATNHLRSQQLTSGFNNASSAAMLRMTGSRFAAAAAKRSSGDGAGIADFKVLAGTSPPVEGDVGGLLRAASSSWSSLAAAEARVSSMSRQNSSGLGSSPALAALAVPSSSFMGQDSFAVTSPAGRGSSGGLIASALPSQDDFAVSLLLLPLQLRLEAILVSAGYAVLELCDSGAVADVAGRASGASGTLSSSSSCEIGSKRGSWAGSAPPSSSTAVTPRFHGRPSFSSSLGSLVSLPPEDMFAALRTSLTVAKPVGTVVFNNAASPVAALAAVVGRSPRQQQDSCGGALLRGYSGEMLFPVDLGLAQLNLSEPGKQGTALLSVGSVSGTPSSSPVASEFSPRPVSYAETAALADSIRGLVAGLQATGPAVARSCGTALEAEFSGHTLMARVKPKLVGCWNPGCVNMAGVSELAGAAKPCGNCKVAVFCSKACEKMAWSSHTMACAKLAALAQ